MKIFIQGRKDGYNVLYPNPTPKEFYQFAYDIQRIDAQNDVRLYGQSFYSLAFTINGVIFSKYIIGYDDQRSNLGYIGISVFMPVQKKITGVDIKNLLDDLVNIYYKNYCPDFNIRNKQEDWILFNSLVESYNIKLKNNIDSENIISGTTDAAYVYFNDTKKIENYFDAPYQEEYQPYRQILFINKELEGKPENPLNALRNSGIDLTGRIDLENPKYKLIFNLNAGNGVRITVKANGTTISNNNKFRRKNELEISWTKQYYKTEIQRGKCFELADKFIIIDKEAGTVTIKEIELLPEEKTITFEIKDSFGNLINDAEILISNSLDNKFKSQEWKKFNSAYFKDEDLGKSWTVTARKGADLISEPHRIDFERDTVNPVVLSLIKKKVVEIKVFDEENGDVVYDFDIWWQLSNGYKRTNKIEFKNDEIIKSWNITINHKDYKPKEVKDFSPAKHNSIEVKLSKKPTEQFANNMHIAGNKADGISKNNIKKPIFKRPRFIAGAILLVIIITTSLIFVFNNPKEVQSTNFISSYQIERYLQDNELFKDTLTKYQTNWRSQMRDIYQNQQDSIESNGVKWYNPFSWFSNDEHNTNYEEQLTKLDNTQNDTISQKIDSAIILRESINSLNFEYLKKQDYSAKQKKFKESIERVKISDYELIRNRLTYIAEYTLVQIADSINTILDSKQTKLEQNEAKNIELESQKNEDKKGGNRVSGSNTKNVSKSSLVTQDEEIKKYLKGGDLRKDKLNEYLNQSSNSDVKGSVKLCLKLWDLDGTKGKSYSSLLSSVSKNDMLKNSDLLEFLNKMNKNENPKYLPQIPGKANIKTLNQLREKIQ